MMNANLDRISVGNVLTDGAKLYKVVPFMYNGDEEVPCIIRESNDDDGLGYPFGYVQSLISGERYGRCGAEDVLCNPDLEVITDGDVLLDDVTHELVDVRVYDNKPTVYGSFLASYDMTRFRLAKGFAKRDIISCVWTNDMYRAVLRNGARVWMTHNQYNEISEIGYYHYVYSPYFGRCIMYS